MVLTRDDDDDSGDDDDVARARNPLRGTVARMPTGGAAEGGRRKFGAVSLAIDKHRSERSAATREERTLATPRGANVTTRRDVDY